MRFRLWTTILGLCPISICFTVIDLSESVSPTKNKNYISKRGQLPKIELKSYIEVDSYVEVEAPEFQNVNFHQNDFVTKNGSEYTVSSSAVTVVFSCRASYPIVWKLPNPEQFESFQTFGLKVSTERISEFTTDLSQPRNLEFRSYITFLNELYLYQTGYLSCESVTNSKLQSTIYVYAEGQNALAIATGQTVIVNLTETSSKITLPCRPSLPDISVSLAKEETLTDSDKTQWIPLEQNESIHFDPKIGFVLDVRTLPDIRGTYRCSVVNEEEEKYCFVRVISGNKMPYKFTPVSAIESHLASISIKNHLVKCCTGKPNLPALGYYTSCENEAECDLMKPIVMHRYLTQRDTLLYNHERASSSNLPGCFNAYVQNYLSPSSILICQGEKLNVVGLISPIYKQELMNTTASIYNNYELIDFANNPQEVGGDKKFSFILESRQRSDLVSQHYYITRGSRLKLKRIYNPNIEYYPDMGGINIDIFVFRSGETIYEGEDIRITCFPLQYFYAKGGWLQLNWKNGSRMVIDSFDNLHPQDVVYRSSVVPGIESKIRISGVINNIDLEVESVDCFTPIWNSVKWEKRTLKLKITPSALPEFENPQDELITLKLNETGIYLNCSVVNAVNEQFVTTKLSWEKDGKRIFGWNENVGQVLQTFGGNVTESSVELFIISHSSAGTYTCTASNVKGKAMKKFVVFVDDGKSKPTVIIIITVVCLSLLLMATTALVWKVWMVRMKLNNVTSR